MSASPHTPLLDVIRGRQIEGVPYFEMFGVPEHIAAHFIGHPPENYTDRIRLAKALGWGSLRVEWFGWAPRNERRAASDGTEHYVQGGPLPLRELEKMEPPDPTEALQRYAEGRKLALEAGLPTHTFILSCFHALSISMGLEHLSYACYDDPDELAMEMELIERYNRSVLQKVVEIGVEFVVFDCDCAFKNGLMVRPEMFRRLWFEPTRRTVAILREADVPYILHSDGKVDDLYPLLIELGFSGAHGVEAMANDLADIKRRFGDKLTLFGNMDVRDLAWDSPDEIRRKTRRMIEIGMPGGRYVPGCNTSIMPYVPVENYLAYWETIREYAPKG